MVFCWKSTFVNSFPSDSWNSVMILAIWGTHVSQRINDESSCLLIKSVARSVDLVALLFCLCTWSRAILENSWFNFWKEKKPLLRILYTSRCLTCIAINSKICTVNHLVYIIFIHYKAGLFKRDWRSPMPVLTPT